MVNIVLVERLGWTLVHSVWQILLVVCVVVLFNRILFARSANGRYLVGCAGLAAMVIAPAVTFALVEPSTMTLVEPLAVNSDGETYTNVSSPPTNIVMQLHVSQVADDFLNDLPTSDESNASSSDLEVVSFQTTNAADEAEASLARGSFWPSLLERLRLTIQFAIPTIVACWILGVVVLAIRPLVGLYTIRRLRHIGRSKVQRFVTQLVKDVSTRLNMRQRVEVAQSTLVQVPAVVGAIRPLLLLPASSITGLSTRELEAIIAHELAHVRRHDYWVNFLQTIVESLLFYHPAVWWLSQQVRQERENCCDDIALDVCENRATFAKALMALEEMKSAMPSPIVAANGGSLLQRIRRIVGVSVQPKNATSWLASGCLLLAIACALVVNGFAIDRAQAQVAVADGASAEEEPQRSSENPNGVDSTAYSGVLRGRFVFDGKPPKRQVIKPNKDLDVVKGKTLYDESLVVGEDGGVANIFVYLRNKDVPVAEVDRLPEPAVLRVEDLTFRPHALAVWTEQPLHIVNDDPVAVAAGIQPVVNDPFNVLVPRRARQERRFIKSEHLPMDVYANIHPWMNAKLLVRDNPYFAVTSHDGSFEIKGLPPGNWEFQFWHEKVGYLKRESGWDKGRVEIEIGDDVTDMGTIKLTASDLNVSAKSDNAQSLSPASGREGVKSSEKFAGTLRGRFIFDGEPPKQRRITPDKDASFYDKKTILDESLVVGPDKGVANVFVWLHHRGGIPTQPKNMPSGEIVLRIKDGKYTPHALAMTTSQKLTIVNEEEVGHNPNVQTVYNPASGLLSPSDAKKLEFKYSRSERFPALVSELIHPWYRAHLLIRDDPYFAITGDDGAFEIKGLPPGKWEFQFWHEKVGYLKRESGWDKGRVEIEIGDDVADMGTIKLTASDLKVEDDRLSQTTPPPKSKSVPRGWYRNAPYPTIGFADQQGIDEAYVRLVAHDPATDELGLSKEQVIVVDQLYRWASEDFFAANPNDDVAKRTAWSEAKSKIDRLLDERQLKRLSELVFQQRRHQVLLDSDILDALNVSAKQRAEIRDAWQAHSNRVKQIDNGYEEKLHSREFLRNGGRIRREKLQSIIRSKESYMQFWGEVYHVLMPEQREKFNDLRGPEIASRQPLEMTAVAKRIGSSSNNYTVTVTLKNNSGESKTCDLKTSSSTNIIATNATHGFVIDKSTLGWVVTLAAGESVTREIQFEFVNNDDPATVQVVASSGDWSSEVTLQAQDLPQGF